MTIHNQVWRWLLAMLLTALPALAQGQSAPAAQGVVAMVDAASPNGNARERGAGIIVHKDAASLYIVTARHVIEPALDKDFGLEIIVHLNASRSVGRRARFVAGNDSEIDLALIKLDFADNPDLRPSELQIALIEPILGAAGVYVIGQGGERPWKTTQFADLSARLLGANKITFEGAEIEAGDSGGGIFDPSGRLVGILQRRQDDFISGASAKAVFDFLAKNGIAYSANGAARCLASPAELEVSQRELQASSLSMTADSLGAAIATVNAVALAKYRKACVSPALVLQALGLRVDGQIAFQRMLAARDRREEAAGWLTETIKDGLSPDAQIALSDNRRASLLALAIEAPNPQVALALLRSGATPNPFIDERGKRENSSTFLFPAQRIAQIDGMSETEKTELVREFLTKGVFVPPNDTQEGFFLAGTISESQANLQAVGRFGNATAHKPSTFCAGRSTPWCQGTVKLPHWLKGADAKAELEDLEVGPLIFADDQLGYYAVRATQLGWPSVGLARVPIYNDWGILTANRDGTQIRIRFFQDGMGGGNPCEGQQSRRADFCWRERELNRVAGGKGDWVYGDEVIELSEASDAGAIGENKRRESDQFFKAAAEFEAKLSAPQSACYRKLKETAPLAKMVLRYMNLSIALPNSNPMFQQLWENMNSSMLIKDERNPYAPLDGIAAVLGTAYNLCRSQ